MENGTEIIQQRDITVVTAELHYCDDKIRACLEDLTLWTAESGRRLMEAKEMLPHGQWGAWLKNEFNLTQRTAENRIKLFKKIGSPQVSLFGAELKSKTFSILSPSQILKLLPIPDEELEDFVKDNDIANKSVREIDRLVKELEEKDKCVEGLKNGIKELQEQLESKNADIDTACSEARIYEEKAGELEMQIAEMNSVSAELSEEEKEKIKTAAAEETRADLQAELDKLKKQIDGANNRADKAEREKDKINKKLAKLKIETDKAQNEATAAISREERIRQEKMELREENDRLMEQVSQLKAEAETKRNDDVVRLNILFETVQGNIEDILDIMNKSREAAEYKDVIRDTIMALFEDERS